VIEKKKKDNDCDMTDVNDYLEETCDIPEQDNSDQTSETTEIDPLEAARNEAKDYLDSLQRLKAEFDNFRKRMAKERQKMAQFHQSVVLEAILPSLDSFDAALRNPDKDVSVEVSRGLKLIYDGLMDNLSRLDFKRMNLLGKPFDPEVAEAVLIQQTDTCEPNLVIGEISAGYLFKQSVLRAARVVVSAPVDSGDASTIKTASEGDNEK
jgi:molecular chaperone GrpE